MSWLKGTKSKVGLEVLQIPLKNSRTWITVITGLVILIVLRTVLIPLFISIGGPGLNIDILYILISSSNINITFFKVIRIISRIIFLWRVFYMSFHKRTLFFFSLSSFVASILLLTIRDRLLMVFLGWEGLGITSFILIVFYQNWLSAKGGLLTLLTNRIGDAILLITLCGVLRLIRGELVKTSWLLVFTLTILTLTKSAQWPFIRWLPAAIAAPTPVSSLVHRSTLVTAGVWLLIRFSSRASLNIVILGRLGVLTLTVASLSALLETDAKKIVALSTLSQLGLIFISLSLGIPSVCFFHIVIHAFAKANLFIVIGRLLHRRFSQQDTRLIRSESLGYFLTITIRVSLLRLIGFMFTAGFFSKEQILIGQAFIINSLISSLLIILIARLTLSYCFKLFRRVMLINPERLFQSSSFRKTQVFPIFVITFLRVIRGIIIIFNISPWSLTIERIEYLYWRIRLLGFGLLSFKSLLIFFCYKGFYIQRKIIDLRLQKISKIKIVTNNLESSGRERIYLLFRFILINLIKQRSRLVGLFSILMTFVLLF